LRLEFSGLSSLKAGIYIIFTPLRLEKNIKIIIKKLEFVTGGHPVIRKKFNKVKIPL